MTSIDYKIDGLTISTVGLYQIGFPEVQVEVDSPTLLEEGESLLRFMARYMTQLGVKSEPGETIPYGYWLVKMLEVRKNLWAVWEYEPEAIRFVRGASLTLQYWRDQHRMCEAQQTHFVPPRPDRLSVVSAGVLEGLPVQAVRYPSPEHMSGWWLITEEYDGNVESLKHENTYHVTSARPDLAKFLALPYGFRFDLTQCEDVWYDPEVAQQSG